MAKLDEFDIYCESDTYLDDQPFKDYCDKVRRVIYAHESPVSTRAIHLVLGEEARPEWTADALEAIRGIEAVGVLPTRYRPSAPRRAPNEFAFNRTVR